MAGLFIKIHAIAIVLILKNIEMLHQFEFMSSEAAETDFIGSVNIPAVATKTM